MKTDLKISHSSYNININIIIIIIIIFIIIIIYTSNCNLKLISDVFFCLTFYISSIDLAKKR